MSIQLTGSIEVFGSVSSSLYGTASWADNSVSSSYATIADSASYIDVSGSSIETEWVDGQLRLTAFNVQSFDPLTGEASDDYLFIPGNAYQNNTLIKSYTNTNAQIVGANALSFCLLLETASLPNVTRLSNSTFITSTNLKQVIAPKVTSLGSGVFQNCSSLTAISLPSASIISQSAFQNCLLLSSVSLPSRLLLS